MHRAVRQRGELVEQVIAEWNDVTEERHFTRNRMCGWRELPSLVEFPVIRQVRLRCDAEHAAMVDGYCAVEKLLLEPERRAHHHQRPKRSACIHDLR